MTRRVLAGLSLGLSAVYAASTLVRAGLAHRRLRAEPTSAPRLAARVSVLQPILSGDPGLATMLAENLANHPDADFVWLVDADDAEGIRVATKVSAGARNVTVRVCPPAPSGVNPKVFKLALALPDCGELVAVLDDDTVLPPGALARAAAHLAEADLVTGLPYYRPGETVWGALVAAFVNANSLLTYLPVAELTDPVTINGMFYLTPRTTLDEVGGFAAIERGLCDDYELALLYRRAGRRIAQTAIAHPLATTVPGGWEYRRIMRRWMLFAGRLLRDLPDDPRARAAVGLVSVPVVLPLAALVCALASGSAPASGAAAGVVVAKAVAMAGWRRRAWGARTSAAGLAAEIVSDLVQPLHAVAALGRPASVTWRGKQFRVDAEGGLR